MTPMVASVFALEEYSASGKSPIRGYGSYFTVSKCSASSAATRDWLPFPCQAAYQPIVPPARMPHPR